MSFGVPNVTRIVLLAALILTACAAAALAKPTVLATSSGYLYPVVSGYGHGRAVAVWQVFEGGSTTASRILTSTRSGGKWDQAKTIAGSKYAGVRPALATFSNGGAVAAWCATDAAPYGATGHFSGVVLLTRRSAKSAWKTKLEAGTCQQASVAAAYGDKAVSVVWVRGTAGGTEQLRLISFNHRTWSKAHVITSSSSSQLLDPQVTANNHGTIVVSWYRGTIADKAEDLYTVSQGIAVKQPSAAWKVTRSLYDEITYDPSLAADSGVTLPHVAIDKGGDAVYVAPQIGDSIFSADARYVAGKWVTGAVPVAHATDAQVVSTPGGEATVLSEVGAGVYATTFDTLTGKFGSSRELTASTAAVLALSTSSNGAATVVTYSGKTLRVFHRRSFTGRWKTTEELTRTGSYLGFQLSDVTAGSALATWVEHAGGQYGLLSAELKL